MFQSLNKKISTLLGIIIVILCAVLAGGITVYQYYGITDLIEPLFQWIRVLAIIVIPVTLIKFVIFYFLILLSFKILKMEKIPRSKIIIFLFVIFLLDIFVALIITKIFGLNKQLLFTVNILVYLGVVFLFLKYYFLLSGKKLWQFLLYLIVIKFFLFLIIL